MKKSLLLKITVISKKKKKNATVLNNFLNIPQYNEIEPVSQNINDPLLAAIIKYSSHPSIIAIKDKCKSDLHFNFSFVEYDEIMKEINNLKTNYFSPQHCLLAMLEKWTLAVDNKNTFGALLTDLSKAFDCLPHDLLVAKLNADGFSLPALKLVLSYLSNRKQRTKINSKFSSWEEVLFGVPQKSILGPLLFNLFICDLFFIMNDIDFASYADDNTSFIVGEDIVDVIFKLQNASKTPFQWFYDNQMKANPDNCHFICSSNEKLNIVIEDQRISNSNCKKLLGVLLNSKLSFKPHVDSIFRKAGLKLNAISRIIPYIDFSKKRLLVNAFFSSQFNYCPLIWICHNRMLNNRINRLHERCL